jgi:N-carbamoylputrescine amidase
MKNLTQLNNKIKVALIQQKYYGSKANTVNKTISMIKESSLNGAKLVVLQELHQTEYFCQSEDVKYFDYAHNYKEDIIFWSNVAKENNIVLVTSLFEKRTAGLYHNTAFVFEKNGTLAGKYRKMHIPDDPGFYEKFYFTIGDIGFEPISTSVGKLGVLICWDQWYPEAARLMCLKGADILIYPTAIGWFDNDSEDEKQRQLNSWITIQKSHSIANGIPLISVNRVGFEQDLSNQLDGIRFWGNSFVCDSQGDIKVKANHKDETIIYSEIDYQNSENTRRIWPFLRDRRIENYSELTKRFID